MKWASGGCVFPWLWHSYSWFYGTKGKETLQPSDFENNLLCVLVFSLTTIVSSSLVWCHLFFTIKVMPLSFLFLFFFTICIPFVFVCEMVIFFFYCFNFTSYDLSTQIFFLSLFFLCVWNGYYQVYISLGFHLKEVFQWKPSGRSCMSYIGE